LLLFAFIASTSLGASGDTGIKGAIKDELGAAIERATVIVSGTPILLSRTNRNGEFAIAVMPGGLYDVFVSALGFAPTCAKLRVEDHHWANFSPTLKVDALTIRLHGDTFDTKQRRASH
jgi:Carboxypeptidase regulatory-like domain